MEQLIAQLRIVLANTFVLYNQAHVLHWNVEGADFPQYHDFFGDVYGELFAALDPIAEHLRFLEAFAPATIPDMLAPATIQSSISAESVMEEAFGNFRDNNAATINALRDAIEVADTENEPAVSNFLQERLGAHQKLAWKIRSILK